MIESDADQRDFLRSYAHTYLQEEIAQEQIVRRLDPFRRFLMVAAQMSGQILNFTRIAREIGSSTVTVQSYFQILEDTLIGSLVEPLHESVRKRQRGNPKFYFFDTGVQRALNNTLQVELAPQTYAFGVAFEHFIVNEIHRLHAYGKKDYRLSYLRTKDGVEIDLIIERPGMKRALVEIKSTDHRRRHPFTHYPTQGRAQQRSVLPVTRSKCKKHRRRFLPAVARGSCPTRLVAPATRKTTGMGTTTRRIKRGPRSLSTSSYLIIARRSHHHPRQSERSAPTRRRG